MRGRRVGKADELLLDPPQAELEAAATVPDVAQRPLEELEAASPLIPFLYAQQDRV
jgi:hypothetical protein